MNRRTFAGFGLAAVGGIFVPQFGRWFQRINPPAMTHYLDYMVAVEGFDQWRRHAYGMYGGVWRPLTPETPLIPWLVIMVNPLCIGVNASVAPKGRWIRGHIYQSEAP